MPRNTSMAASVFTSLSDLEAGDAEGVYRHFVLPRLNEFAAPVFERICLEFVRKRNREGRLPFTAIYSLFSKSGFSRGLMDEAGKNESLSLYTLADVLEG
jgi:hypothetical protein